MRQISKIVFISLLLIPIVTIAAMSPCDKAASTEVSRLASTKWNTTQKPALLRSANRPIFVFLFLYWRRGTDQLDSRCTCTQILSSFDHKWNCSKIETTKSIISFQCRTGRNGSTGISVRPIRCALPMTDLPFTVYPETRHCYPEVPDAHMPFGFKEKTITWGRFFFVLSFLWLMGRVFSSLFSSGLPRSES